MSLPDKKDVTVNPEMIILARESRGLTQTDLAARLAVTQGRVSKMEAGLLAVPEGLLVRLADSLGYPPSFFYQAGQRMSTGIAEVFHRKRCDVQKRVLEQVYAMIEVRLRHLAILLRSVDIANFDTRLDADEYDGRVEEIAQLVRATWRVPRGPIKNLISLLENVGIIVIPIDFRTRKIDAIYRSEPHLPPVFFVNTESPKDRLRFSLAHELGHLIMHAYPGPDMERQADRFAAEFLLPERDIKGDLHDLTLQRLAVLKRYWRVSMAAILHRAQDLKSITDNQARYLWSQMSRAGYRTREPVELDDNGEVPSLLAEIIAMHREDLDYSAADLSEVLHLLEPELREIYLPRKPRNTLRMVR